MAQNIAIKRLMTKAKREHYPYFYQQGSLIPLDELQEGHYLRASHVFLPLEKKCAGVPSIIKPPGLYARYYFTGRYTGSGSATGFSSLSLNGWAFQLCPAPMNTVFWTAWFPEYGSLCHVN